MFLLSKMTSSFEKTRDRRNGYDEPKNEMLMPKDQIAMNTSAAREEISVESTTLKADGINRRRRDDDLRDLSLVSCASCSADDDDDDEECNETLSPISLETNTGTSTIHKSMEQNVLSAIGNTDDDGSVDGNNSICDNSKWQPNLSLGYSVNAKASNLLEFVPFTPVGRIPYVHGSYASAAPQMICNEYWMRILRRLLPANHADVVEIIRAAEERSASKSATASFIARIMKWAENNPVIAAYGMLHSDSGKESNLNASNNGSEKEVAVLEWDVFLDPTLVKNVDTAMDVVAQMKDDDSADYQALIAADIEVDRQVGRLVKRMMLAHGSAGHLVSEAIGVGSAYNFMKMVEEGESQMLYRRKEAERDWKRSGNPFGRNGFDTGGKQWLVNHQTTAPLGFEKRTVVAGKASAKPAGWNVERWLSLFLRALHLGKAADVVASPRIFSIEDDETSPRHHENESLKMTKPPMCGIFLCFGDPNVAKVSHGNTSMAITAKHIEAVLGSRLRVILDLKSRRVSSRVWARVIDTMQSRGLNVKGLGSFDVDELRSVQSLCASSVTAVRFFHSAGDLQKACHAKEVQIGDTVFFNAGSLVLHNSSTLSNVIVCGQRDVSQAVLDEDDEHPGIAFHPFAFPNNDENAAVWKRLCRSSLHDYKNKFMLSIGCYVQEFSISESNLDAISRFLNKHKAVYNLGLAFGGVNGQCPFGLAGDGYWKQSLMGRGWDRKAGPSDDKLLQPEDHHLVQKAALAGAWGNLGTINTVGEEAHVAQEALQLGACVTQHSV